MQIEMKLWGVEVVHQLVVKAKDSTDARFFAKEAIEESSLDEPYITKPEEITDALDLPSSWDDECIPFGVRDPSNPDMTIAEFLEQKRANEQQNSNQLLLPGFE